MTALNMPIPSSRRRGRSAASWGRWGAASACRRWRTSFPEQAQTQEIMNMVKVNYKKCASTVLSVVPWRHIPVSPPWGGGSATSPPDLTISGTWPCCWPLGPLVF